MQIIRHEQLDIPKNRQRKVFTPAKLTDLKESIRNIGLMHPIVVRNLGEDRYELVAGERRARAIRELDIEVRCNGSAVPAGFYPTICIDELSPLKRKEAELDENIRRENLTWQELDDAQAELHHLRVMQNPAQTLEATAQEIAGIRDISARGAAKSLTRSVLVSRNLHRPEINNARSSTEAARILYTELEARFSTALAQKVEKDTAHAFIKGSCQETFPTLPSEQFDCIIADPPYGIGADQFGDAGGSHEYDDSPEAAREIWTSILKEGYRVTKERAHLYFFCDILHFNDIREMGGRCGWSSQRTPIIWNKGAHGHDPNPGIGFKRTYELFIFFFKGNKPAKNLSGDIISVSPSSRAAHAAAKPVDLYVKLLDRSCVAGDRVLDPCCGSGTIFPAASKLAIKATGIEPAELFATLSQARVYSKD